MTDKHRNDIYGDVAKDRENEGAEPAIPAATVLLLRQHEGEPEVLMLHKTSKIAFGGMWVFPGGKIDAADFPSSGDVDAAARNAAVREQGGRPSEPEWSGEARSMLSRLKPAG